MICEAYAPDQMQSLRLRASELLLREKWRDSAIAYSKLIDLCEARSDCSDVKRSLCLAFSNRAEAFLKLRQFHEAIEDCDRALAIEGTHIKSLICKGKILLVLNDYSDALLCFQTALLNPQCDVETLNSYVEKCRRLQYQSRTGVYDVSDWVMSGFRGESPDLGEFVGPVEVMKSGLNGRGLFATKDMEVGTYMMVTKAVAIERGIIFEEEDEARLVMWRCFVKKVVEIAKRSKRVRDLILCLSTGEQEETLEVPDIETFKNSFRETRTQEENIDQNRIVSILNVNSLIEGAVCAKVLGKNKNYYGVGLWLLPALINHSCSPNARRLHIGDHVAVLASRDIKAGEEITFAYFDVLRPLQEREELGRSWGFICNCSRCEFEKGDLRSEQYRSGDGKSDSTSEDGEMEIIRVEKGRSRDEEYLRDSNWEDYCKTTKLRDGKGDPLSQEREIEIARVERRMREEKMRSRERGYLRASNWEFYSNVFESKQDSRKVAAAEVVADSMMEAVGSDERVMNVLVGRIRSNGEMDRVMKLGRGIYGKAVKTRALKYLLKIATV